MPTQPQTFVVKIRRGDVRNSLRASMGDGVFASVMVGLVESFFMPFALALRFSTAQISCLAAIPPLVGAFSQWWTATLARHCGGRRNLLLRVVWGQVVSLALLAVVPWMPAPWRVPALILLVAAYVAFGGLSGPVWNSLMAEYIPPARRAGYFGWRNRITGTVVIVSALLTGTVLHRFGKPDTAPAGVLAGFSLLLLAAALSRGVSAGFIIKFYEPALSARSLPAGDFGSFWSETRGGPFWKFLAFGAGLTFAANLSGPYFAIYMIRDLKFSYLTYTLAMVTVNFSLSYMMPLWGRKADEVGTHRILRVCAWLTPVLPFLWLVSKSPAYVVCLQVLGGWVWSGISLCQTNYLIESVPSRLRTQAIAYFNVLNGMALFAGAFIGGYLLHILPPTLGFPFLTALVISGVLRVFVCAFLLPNVGAVRSRPPVSDWQVFYSATGLRPLVGIYRGAWQLLGR